MKGNLILIFYWIIIIIIIIILLLLNKDAFLVFFLFVPKNTQVVTQY